MAMKPIKVSQLNRYIKTILQTDPVLSSVSVVGEISNFKLHSSGHVYFSLKDEDSKVSCFLPADVFRRLNIELSDGMEVTVYGYIYLYERGGSYSINIRSLEAAGMGDLAVRFEELKKKLAAEGLFDESRKRPIPTFPKKVAVVTSSTGAAVRDVLKIIKSKNDYADVLVYPCLVQGPDAPASIAAAIGEVNRLFPETDTLIVGRGGGAIEELWAFNEEIVARAIAASRIPVISAVGHETDFTIADFVADRRAETPTAAANMAVPDTGDLREYLATTAKSLSYDLENRLSVKDLAVKTALSNLNGYMDAKIEGAELKISGLRAEIKALSPKGIMERGYAAVTKADGSFVASGKALNEGDEILLTMADAKVTAAVEKVRGEEI